MKNRWIYFFCIFTLSLQAVQKDFKQTSKGTQFLQQISEAFTELADYARPASVSIKAVLVAPQPSPYDRYQDDFFFRFFGPQFPQGPREQTASGSGFLITEDGYIVTNYHVIRDAKQIFVTISDGKEFEATLKGTDEKTDLAVLKIEETNLPYLTFGDSDELKVGEWVVAVGNPFGLLEGSITQGIVSAKGRQDLGIAAYEDFIQTDAAINNGNSGGALLNMKGEVIGVNSAKMGQPGAFSGIGFAIPSRMVQPVIEQIIQDGSVKRAYLGVVLQPIDKELANALNLGKAEGILVADVIKGSPADQAGLKSGDVILSYDGKSAKSVNSFRNDVAMMSPGSKVEIQALRNRKMKKMIVSLGSQEESEFASEEKLKKLGIEVEELTPESAGKLGYAPDTKGLVITKVKPNSPAAIAGLRPSFLITAVATDWDDQKPIESLSDLSEALANLKDKKHVILIVRHQNFRRFYTIRIDS